MEVKNPQHKNYLYLFIVGSTFAWISKVFLFSEAQAFILTSKMLEMYLFQPIQENLLGGLYHQSAMDSQYIPHGHSKRIDHLSLY